MGLQCQTGWRGKHRALRELGHGAYLFWILLQLAFTWGVGVSRFIDNKHHPSDVRSCMTLLLHKLVWHPLQPPGQSINTVPKTLDASTGQAASCATLLLHSAIEFQTLLVILP